MSTRQFMGLLQTSRAVALFFWALHDFSGSSYSAVSLLAGLVFNKSSLPLFKLVSAASRAS